MLLRPVAIMVKTPAVDADTDCGPSHVSRLKLMTPRCDWACHVFVGTERGSAEAQERSDLHEE
jgi:hypothetical protein